MLHVCPVQSVFVNLQYYWSSTWVFLEHCGSSSWHFNTRCVWVPVGEFTIDYADTSWELWLISHTHTHTQSSTCWRASSCWSLEAMSDLLLHTVQIFVRHLSALWSLRHSDWCGIRCSLAADINPREHEAEQRARWFQVKWAGSQDHRFLRL